MATPVSGRAKAGGRGRAGKGRSEPPRKSIVAKPAQGRKVGGDATTRKETVVVVTTGEEKQLGGAGTVPTVKMMAVGCEEADHEEEDDPTRATSEMAELDKDFAEFEKTIIQSTDMPDAMQQVAVDCAREALQNFKIDNQVAGHIKHHFDKTYKPTWHCIVGSSFGSFLSYEQRTSIYMTFDEPDRPQRYIVLFKHGGKSKNS